MEQLKERLFGVLSNTTKVLNFEQWLYANEKLVNLIDQESFVFDVYNLNYKSDYIVTEIEKLFYLLGDKEEIIIAKIISNCRLIVKTNDDLIIKDALSNTLLFFDWEENYSSLLYTFRSLDDEIDMSVAGVIKKINVNDSATKLAQLVLFNISKYSYRNIKEVLDIEIPIDAFVTLEQNNIVPFWKRFFKN